MSHLSFVTTADGSKTIFNEKIGENYHSRHGALQESQHVFLKTGLIHFLEKNNETKVSVLEVGFGTGLNFLVTADYCLKNKIALDYSGIEAYPLDEEMIAQTGYGDYIPDSLWNNFLNKYPKAFDESCTIDTLCSVRIIENELLQFTSQKQFDVVYFDAFAAIHQAEMWNIDSLTHISKFIKPGGVFVTYAITGELKRSMKSLGFSIEKAPGAPGKREMLRATKL
jgi:tRNA U34 5-methylaminomethyl-2-thiouridine-forming methyltransferase MnmC